MANFNLDNYVPVNERLEKFYADHPNGRVITNILEHDHNTGFVLFQAMIYRDCDCEHPAATGHAYEVAGQGHVNKTSHIENCETSAVGRALAMLGYEIQRGIASREEMAKASGNAPAKAMAATANGSAKTYDNKRPDNPIADSIASRATAAQTALLLRKAEQAGVDPMTTIRGEWEGVERLSDLSKAAASYIIDQF